MLVAIAGVIVGLAGIRHSRKWRLYGGGATILLSAAIIMGVLTEINGPQGTISQSPLQGSPYLEAALADHSAGKYPGVRDNAFNNAGAIMAAADTNGPTYIGNLSTSKVAVTVPLDSSYSTASANWTAFSPDGTIMATGDSNGRIYLWNTNTWSITATLADPAPGKGGVNKVAFNPTGTIIATADSNGKSFLWDSATRKVLATLPDPANGKYGVDSIAFNSAGTIAASADSGGSTFLWHIG